MATQAARAARPAPEHLVGGELLASVGRRLSSRAVARALLAGGAAAAVALLLAALAAPWGPLPAVRILLAAAVIGALAGAPAIALVRRGRRGDVHPPPPAPPASARDAFALSVVQRIRPDLAFEIRSARELATAPEPRFSPDLLAAHRDAVAAEISHLVPAALLPSRGMLRAGAWLAAAVSLWAVVLAVAPGRVQSGLLLLAGAARIGDTPGRLRANPLVADLSADLIYPAYMQRAPRTLVSFSGDLVAPRGTRVTLRAQALYAVAAAAIRFSGGEILPLGVEAGRSLHGSFVLQQSATYGFDLRRADGSVEREGVRRRLTVEPDAPPHVTLDSPVGDVELEERDGLEIAFQASDDFGLTDVDLVIARPGGEELRLPIEHLDPAQREVRGRTKLAIRDLRLAPGERVAARLEARDADTIGGPKRASSRTFYVLAASPLTRHRAILGAEEDLMKLLANVLADRLEAPPAEGPRAGATFEPLRQQTEEVLGLLGSIVQSIQRDRMSRLDDPTVLGAMRERLSDLLVREARLYGAEPAPLGSRTAIDREQQAEIEADLLLIEDLLGRQRLEELSSLAAELTRSRDRLEQLLQRYQQSRAERARRELLAEIDRMEQQMREMLARIAELERRVPAEFANLDALGRRDLLATLDRVREAMAADDPRAALEALRALEGELRDLMAALEGELRQYQSERFAEAERATAELMREVDALRAREEELERQTAEVHQRFRDQVAGTMRDRIDPLVARLLDKVREARGALGRAPAADLAPYDREALDRAHGRLEDVDATLRQGDLDEARQMAQQASGALESLRSSLDFSVRLDPAGESRDASSRGLEAARAAIPPTREVLDELQRALPRPSELLGADDVDRLRRSAEAQRNVANDTGRIGQRFGRGEGGEGRPGALPFLAREARRMLGEAEREMRRGAERLDATESSEALEAQDRAIQRLTELRQSLERSNQPMGLESEGRFSEMHEPVRIPRPEEHQVPHEFRRQVLDAMRESTPERYEEQVRRYYEELVR